MPQTTYLLEPDFRLEPREAPSDTLASAQQPVPPLTSAVLRGMPHHAAEQDSGSRRSSLPWFGAPQPGLRSDLLGLPSDLPGLSISLPGLSADLPGLSALLSGKHNASISSASRTAASRSRRTALEFCFPRLDTGVQPNVFAPHSTTVVHKTSPVLASITARSTTLDARPARLLQARARTAVSASETAEQDFSFGLRGPQDGQPVENVFQGPMKEVCRTLLRPPPLQQ